MPDCTAEQIAAAIAEPRVGDVWEVGKFTRRIVKFCEADFIKFETSGKAGYIFHRALEFRRWAKEATLLHRSDGETLPDIRCGTCHYWSDGICGFPMPDIDHFPEHVPSAAEITFRYMPAHNGMDCQCWEAKRPS